MAPRYKAIDHERSFFGDFWEIMQKKVQMHGVWICRLHIGGLPQGLNVNHVIVEGENASHGSADCTMGDAQSDLMQ